MFWYSRDIAEKVIAQQVDQKIRSGAPVLELEVEPPLERSSLSDELLEYLKKRALVNWALSELARNAGLN
jgi:hypothetical protein